MNWLDRARREIGRGRGKRTAVTAERHPMAVTAVPAARPPAESAARLHDEYEERAAIMQYDGGLSREEAERLAWLLVYDTGSLH